jgi:hypothetical protein
MATWTCPRCQRAFTRKNQRHRCGANAGPSRDVLRGRSDALIQLYESVEAFARSLGPIEIVARERYVLFRTRRIFTDLVIMKDALRIAIHLPSKIDDPDPIFFKIVSDERHVTHVAKLHVLADFAKVKHHVKAAHAHSLR